ncbi:MAG: aminoacyl-tRNA deacylase [Acidobacteriota bacterium]|nr:aminoacyl-tRNA deacylase [Acidobacteriota bacterium]MDH3528677.1 aminoacyl-tRNA deacylase [Acidobacteriota bacterium]
MKYPITQAVRILRSKGVEIVPHLFEYVEKGGTSHSSEALGVSEDEIVKTLVFETNDDEPLIVLMRGHMMVSTKKLARHIGIKSVAPATPEKANRLTGYVIGGTSPFGLKTEMPIYAEESIFELEKIYINGGKRGFLVELAPAVLKDVLDLETVEVGIEKKV